MATRPVLRPLPHVPQHVVQAPRVRRFLAHRLRAMPAVVAGPRNLVEIPVTIPGRSRSRRVLPLRLRRQPVPAPSGAPVQPPDERLRFVLRNLLHGTAPAVRETEGLVPITACQWSCVTSCLASQNPWLISTYVTGCS